jgi:hypothetical protein
MKMSIVKQLNNTFVVAYPSDYEKLKRIKVGDVLECEIKKPRNYKFHKKFFALIEMVYQNQEIYVNKDELREDLTIEAGYFTERVDMYGELKKRAVSISFASMSEYDFEQYYSAVIQVIVNFFKFDRQDIIDNIEQYY